MRRLALVFTLCTACGATGVANPPRSEHPVDQPARFADALGTVTGKVTNQRTGAALADAMVIARADSGAETGARTGRYGAYELALQPGVYTLSFYFDKAVVVRKLKVHRRGHGEANVALDVPPGTKAHPATPWHLFPKRPQSMPRPRTF